MKELGFQNYSAQISFFNYLHLGTHVDSGVIYSFNAPGAGSRLLKSCTLIQNESDPIVSSPIINVLENLRQI